MEDNTKREEPLSEELLEWITGASGNGNASTSNHPNPGPGNFLDCQSCQAKAREYAGHISRSGFIQAGVDTHVTNGNYELADIALRRSTGEYLRAQEVYGAMEAHGHPDFPAALREQRRNYNPQH